jgi:hypothetical protein
VNITIRLYAANKAFNLWFLKNNKTEINNSIAGIVQTIRAAKELNKGDWPS